MTERHEMVAIKRKWVPEWVYAIFSWPVDLVRIKWLPFRYILTKPVKSESPPS